MMQHSRRLTSALVAALAFAACAACGGSAGGSSRFVPTDPAVAGRYAVVEGTAELTVAGFGTYGAQTYLPAAVGSDGGTGATPPARMPGIVLSNGLASPGSAMSWISRHLASHGYVVLTFTPANTLSLDMTEWAAGFQGGFDALLGESSDSVGALAGRADPARIGAVALSAGGAGAIEAAGKDARVAAVVAFAPGINDLGRFLFKETIDASAHVTAPTQIQVGTEDCLVNPRPPSLLAFTNLGHTSVETYYDAIPARRQFLEIAGANHLDYMDEAAAQLAVELLVDAIPIDCAAKIPTATQHTIAQKYATMWLDTYVYGTGAWQDSLFGAGVAADLTAGVLTRVRSDPPSP